MSTPSADNTEILLHITAASRASDDAFSRQLAQAYLDFRPQRRTQIQLRSHDDSNRRVNQASLAGRDQAPEPSSRQAIASTPLQIFEINSQDISFESALDNRSSPRLLHALPRDVVIPSSQPSASGSQTSWCEPPSQISDSYPVAESGRLTVSPSRIFQRYVGGMSRCSPSQTPPSPSPRKRRAPSSPSPRKRNASASTSTSEEVVVSSLVPPSQDVPPSKDTTVYVNTGSVIPFTPIIPEDDPRITQSPERDQGNDDIPPSSGILFDITHISSSAISVPSTARSPRAESEPPLTKRGRISAISPGDLVRSSSDTGPTTSTSTPTHEKLDNSVEIRPASPPVGVDDMDPEDMVTPKFSKLAQDLSSRYRPEAKRELDPFERGYWLLDCTSWSTESRANAWVFLSNYLQGGFAGWGTWCRRGEDHDWIRLYSWGHVAKHTYLLLYVASNRNLKTTGAGWYDAEGKLVVEIPPYKK